MEFTIKSIKLGKDVTFWRGYGRDKSYVFVDLNGQSGCLGCQICYGGELTGDCITTTEDTFEHVCRNWWRIYLQKHKELGLGGKD